MPFLVLGPLIKTKEWEKGYPYSKGATQEPRLYYLTLSYLIVSYTIL